MSDVVDPDDNFMCMEELLGSSKELDDVPPGMSQIMSRIFDKSKKLAVPLLLFSGTTAAAIATGGTALVVAGICGASIKLLSSMMYIYKDSKNSDSKIEAKKKKERNDEEIKDAMGKLSNEIADNIELLGSSIHSRLKDMSSCLESIDRKLDKLLTKSDIDIETAFCDIEKKLRNKSYSAAAYSLNQLNLYDLYIQSNISVEKAEDMIRKELSEHGKKGALEMYFYLLGVRQKYESLIQIKYFLKDMKESVTDNICFYLKQEAKEFIDDLEGYWRIMKNVFQDQIKLPVVLVVGKTGTGKSTLCNIMAGLPEDADDEDDGFTTSPETTTCTDKATVKEFCYFGDPMRPLTIIDTPGFDDPNKNHDAEIIADFVNVLKNKVDGVNLIVFALNGLSPRLEGSLKAMFTIIREMFGPQIWDNLAVVFTKVRMDRGSIKHRNKKTTGDHDENMAEGFIATMENEFKPANKCKQLQYLYIDAHFNDENEEEASQIQECKEKLWNLISGNYLFKTDHVQEVMTENAHLKKKLQEKESEIEARDRRVLELENQETERIAVEYDETRKPVQGFTFLQFRDRECAKKHIFNYVDFIARKCNTKLESSESFSEILNTIEEADDDLIGFVSSQSDLLKSEQLLHIVPRKHDVNKVSQMVFILEICNFTQHFLTHLDISIEEGNEKPVCVWLVEKNGEDESSFVRESVIEDPATFLIPPYTKERLIFRNSGHRPKSQLSGTLTMNIGEFGETTLSEQKMMVSFNIDGGKFWTNDTKFYLGLPEMDKSSKELHKMIKENKGTEDFCEHITFSKSETKKTFIQSQTLRFPPITSKKAGDFNLYGGFGNADHCKCILILSQIPEISSNLITI